MPNKEETLDEFATRVAREIGNEGAMDRIHEAAKAFCHYGNGGSSINSCCQYSYRCREAAKAGAKIRFGRTLAERPLPIPDHLVNPEQYVSRSIFITVQQDNALRQLAHENGCTKSDLIRAAVTAMLQNRIVFGVKGLPCGTEE